MKNLIIFILMISLYACSLRKQVETDFAKLEQKDKWFRHPSIGDPSFDNFKRYNKNPIQRGIPPFNWPVNGFYFKDPVSGNEYLFNGQYRSGYAAPPADQKELDISKRSLVYMSEDHGQTWVKKGPVFMDEAVMLEGESGPVMAAPDVTVVYLDGKYYMALDYVTTKYHWGYNLSDTKNYQSIKEAGIAVAVSDHPEGPYTILSKPVITNRYFFDDRWFGKYYRCYAATLIKTENQWIILFDLDSHDYYSWGLAAISAPKPEGPWSKPVFILGPEKEKYHPSLMEFFPAFQYRDTIYAPATGLSHKDFQCIFRAPASEAMRPDSWKLWKEGSLWHSLNVENEYEGMWGQTFTGFINQDNLFKVMFPSRDKENRGTINLASVPWNKMYRDSGFVFTGHETPSFSHISGFYDSPGIEARFSYYGSIAFAWNYHAPFGVDQNTGFVMNPLMFSSNYRLQLDDTRWLLLQAASDGKTDTISTGKLDKKFRSHLKISNANKKTTVSLDDKTIWQGQLPGSEPGYCGIFAMEHSGMEVSSFIVEGEQLPGYSDWLYTEGLRNSGENMNNWEKMASDSLFIHGIGAVSGTDTLRAKWSFTGTGFDLISPKMPGLGTVEIKLNGTSLGEINLWSETPQKSTIVFSMHNLPGRKNAVVLKSRKGRMAVDCLRVYD